MLTWNRCPLQNKFPTKKEQNKKWNPPEWAESPPSGGPLVAAHWNWRPDDGHCPSRTVMCPTGGRWVPDRPGGGGWTHIRQLHMFFHFLCPSVKKEMNFFSFFSFCVHWRGEHSVINTSCNVLERSKWDNYHTVDHYGTLSRSPPQSPTHCKVLERLGTSNPMQPGTF